MELGKLPEEVMSRIDHITRGRTWCVLQWWVMDDTYFVIAQKYGTDNPIEVYCLKITPDKVEESNILYFSLQGE